MTQQTDPTPAPAATSRTRSRLQLLLIVAMFFGSFAIAAALFFSGWKPSAHGRNYGDLLDPPIDVNGHALVLDADAPWPWQNSEREWTALVRIPTACNDACWQAVAMLPRVRGSLGRHAPRFRLLLLDSGIPDLRREALQPMRSASAEKPLPLPALPVTALLPDLWLVDPHGYVVLHYAPGFDPSKLRKDLGKLLK